MRCRADVAAACCRYCRSDRSDAQRPLLSMSSELNVRIHSAVAAPALGEVAARAEGELGVLPGAAAGAAPHVAPPRAWHVAPVAHHLRGEIHRGALLAVPVALAPTALGKGAAGARVARGGEGAAVGARPHRRRLRHPPLRQHALHRRGRPGKWADAKTAAVSHILARRRPSAGPISSNWPPMADSNAPIVRQKETYFLK